MRTLRDLFQKITRSVVISRPILWTGPVIFYLSAICFPSVPWNLGVYVGLICITYPFSFVVMALNDLSDMHSDAHNPRKGGMQGAVLRTSEIPWLRSWIWIFTIGLLAIVAVINAIAFLYFSALIALAYAYSMPPLRLKNRPVIDMLSNMFGAYLLWGLAFAFLHHAIGGAEDVSVAAWALIGGAGMFHALGAVLDRTVDAHAKETTIATKLGAQGTFACILTYFGACLVFLRPLHPLLHGYLIMIFFSCLYLTITKKWVLIHKLVWMFEIALPLMIVLLFLFSPEYMRIVLRP